MVDVNMPSGCNSEQNLKEAANTDMDIEQAAAAQAYLRNTTVHNISWKGITVTVKDRETKLPKTLVQQREILALMGPSGSGKTTLLNHLASRPTTTSSTSSGQLLINGRSPSPATLRTITRFVEQDDALLGSLTVRETLHFASRLSSSGGASLSARERIARIDGLLDAFGLREQADTLVGTPLRKGISGGQKRRLGVASQLITGPKVLFLDEPTSGLDSVAGWEVLIVVASIHQPSTSTFNLFDKVMLLSHGKMHYFGPVSSVTEHYESLGYQVPIHVNPAEFLLEMVNTDFAPDRAAAVQRLEEMHRSWMESRRAKELAAAVANAEEKWPGDIELEGAEKKPGTLSVVMTLLHRSFVKSYRDVVVYGVRLAMYTGLAIMMGTVWLRLDTTQESIIPLTNAIFFGSAFMSFMACAYAPAYLEDYMQFIKEKRNGLYGVTEMIVSNFLIGTPYLFIFALVFSSISYWLSNFQPTAQAFFTWVLWVFLDLLAAEGLVVLLTSIFPSFVISLALVAFANGLWMSVNGFMVPPTILNVFYRYVFHYWDYQKYVFENMMVNEFSNRVYSCGTVGDQCQCMWQTDLANECLIRGQGVLDQYGYKPGYMGKDIGIMMGIIFGYRLAAWIVLKLKR
ncbi:ABC transporter G family member 15 [Madurella mycetomatis]|uniref:ABC transporter G family member 15 n=1 Tax=Madurella mycetomatis TaxID=100816 RepID=A0A175WC31_9PEZI|nr:ABC transporter G family member 15 [Madurella mycetomatis]